MVTGTYYWDSYWIVKGLLLSDMRTTARGIIENIITLVDEYGHMPNGNRIYYIKRSQPPMLIQMAAEYYDCTKNDTFIKTNLKVSCAFRNYSKIHTYPTTVQNICCSRIISLYLYGGCI